ncbi:TNFAIP3-interacting protein 3-like [Gadus macrocephalus]|uniref:TNFAIP3-interacting protein 3-like n=1 Tax=Gadus macrocephalus TaxID=80720 RepID=UPI0028CB41CB|nr:TNFAIP3-interacting protein 3-like [Gadus macrocephalus]
MDKQLIPDTTNAEQVNHLYPSLPISARLNGEELHGVHRGGVENITPAPARQTNMSSADMSSVQAQLDMLWKQREELISINNKWADQYKVMTQYYKAKVREQQPSAKTSQPSRPLNEEMCQNGVEQNVPEKDVKEETSEEKIMSHTDAEQLRVQNAHLTRRGQHQHEEIRRLNQALQQSLESGFVWGESREDPKDNVWKHQAEVYKEDFLKERKDRERLKGKLMEMEKKYRKTHSELHTLKSKITWAPVLAPPVAMCDCPNRAPPANNYTTYPPTEPQQIHNHTPRSAS